MIHGERLVLVLVVNVQVDGIGRNFFVAKSFGDFINALFRFVAVTRLLKSQSPQRRQLRATNQCREVLHDFCRCRAGEHVIIDLASFSTKRIKIVSLFPKIESTSPGIVEKNAVGQAFAEAHEKGDRLVEGIS